MTRIASTQHRITSLPCHPDRVYAFFSQPLEMIKAMEGLRRCEMLPHGAVRWVLQSLPGIEQFEPDYVVVYRGDGRSHLRWQSVSGNMCANGEILICSGPNGSCSIRYHETLEPDLAVPNEAASVVSQLISRQRALTLDRLFDQAADLLSN